MDKIGRKNEKKGFTFVFIDLYFEMWYYKNSL